MEASVNKYESSIINNKTKPKTKLKSMKTFTTFQRSTKHQYNNFAVASFKGRGENTSTYLTAAACQEQIDLYENTVVPYFEELIQNEEGELKTLESWFEALEKDNTYIKETFDKVQKEYSKLLKTVPEDLKPFISISAPIFKYNFPKHYKTLEEAIKDIKDKLEAVKNRKAEAKAKLRLMTGLYNKAKQELELFKD